MSRSCDLALLWLSRILSILAWVAGLNYAVWRWRRVFQTSYWISLPFIVSEGMVILLGSGLFYFQIWKGLRRRPQRLSTMGISPKRWPTVDVFVPTYREPAHVVERTLRAALRIKYPRDKLVVHLLDDGGSMEGRDLADRLQREMGPDKHPKLRYITRLRKFNQPHHAKAGNLNHAIFEQGTSGQYLLILDCDMVAKPYILDALMPHVFTPDLLVPSDQVAMVQSPQSFFNVPKRDALNEQSPLFYQVLMPGWDAWGATPCCGTNVIFQRRALEEIGGFSYGSITEDFLTSCNLASRGFVTKYTWENLAEGLAPDDLDAFFSQRLRWAVGGLQIWRYFNPMFKRGLTIPQRILYTWAGAHYLLSVPTLLLISTPFIFLLDDGKLLLSTGTAMEYLSYFLPFYLTHMCVSAIAHRRLGLRYFINSQNEGVYLLGNHIKACLITASGVQLGFQVTRKDGIKSPLLKDLPYVLPHLMFLLVGGAALASGVVHLAIRNLDNNIRLAYTINLLWGTMIMLQLWPPVGLLLSLHLNEEEEGEGKQQQPPYCPVGDEAATTSPAASEGGGVLEKVKVVVPGHHHQDDRGEEEEAGAGVPQKQQPPPPPQQQQRQQQQAAVVQPAALHAGRGGGAATPGSPEPDDDDAAAVNERTPILVAMGRGAGGGKK